MAKDITAMHVALDYDDTYTRNPKMWDKIIKKFHKGGCEVFIVSMRHPDDGNIVEAHLEGVADAFFFTNGEAKLEFMQDKGIKIDVWIDDMPHNILFNRDDSEDGDGDDSESDAA